jgi:hypothetical protein
LDKVRKLGQWVWLSKERIVLVAMISVFAYRVYLVAYPQDTVEPLPTFATPRPPVEPLVGEPVSEPMPPPPPPPLGDLVRSNMFWVHARDLTADAGQQARQEVNLRLVNIMRQPDGRIQAHLRTDRNQNYYVEEGARFEIFTLREVNADERYVVVFSEQLGDEVRLDLP